ncbi:MAG: IS66 family insertion sequence element accessory protein TnpA [Oscillospiraceae bacterium]
MTLKNWAQEVAECQSSGMTVSAWCELHRINIKTYYDHLRQIRESLLTENCVVLLSTKSISDNIEIFSVDERIKPAVFYLSERSRCRCRLFGRQNRIGKRHGYQRISDNHLPHRRKTVTAEI